MIIPPKLSSGDTIRVIAPSRSMSVISVNIIEHAQRCLSEVLGLKVTFGKRINEVHYNKSWPLSARIEDIHAAFRDTSVKAVLTAIGWYSSNNLLPHLDYDLIANNPKIFCGYSDITALGNAITSKTGLITYNWPHFSSFAMQKGNEYTIEYFKKCLFADTPFSLAASPFRNNDKRYEDQDNRTFIPNPGFISLISGKARGRLVWGNLNTFNLLQWSDYFPKIESDVILLLEDVGFSSSYEEIDRNLDSLLQASHGQSIAWIIVWRFPQEDFDVQLLKEILLSKYNLQWIPIIYNADFGHTFPICTLPIWWQAYMHSDPKGSTINIFEH